MESTIIPVFDGHNDVLTRLMMAGGVSQVHRFATGLDGHVDLPKAKKGGFAGGFFALWVPSPALENEQNIDDLMTSASYQLPLDVPVKASAALLVVMEQAAILLALQATGALKICTTAGQIKQCMQNNIIAAVLHMEGAEAIDADFHALEVLYEVGLRSLGPVWSRKTIFAEGVPFRFPSSPDIGSGLTDAGVELVKRCNHLKIMLDVSHLNEAGFWDIAKHTTQPIVATHSNAHALCAHARNLTDKQLSAIAETNGMVGLNFATAFLRNDGRMVPDVSLQRMLEHLDYLLEKLGENCVGLGSDFDGATVPSDIGSIAGLPHLTQAMSEHGYSAQLIEKLCSTNWIDLLERTWGQ